MIEWLRGTLLRKEGDHVIVDVNGVGYGLDVPLTAVPGLGEPGQTVELEVYLHVTVGQAGGGFSLYGFPTEKERELFLVLLSAPGIGPAKALDIMSAVRPEELVQAVLQGDLNSLGRLKGVGKKTAEKLVVNLRDKMKRYVMFYGMPESAAAAEGAVRSRAGGGGVSAGGGASLREAVEALEALGVKPLIAERAAQKALEVLGAQATTAELVREGLKHRK